MKTVLIVGAAGGSGSATARALVRRGDRVPPQRFIETLEQRESDEAMDAIWKSLMPGIGNH